MRAAALTAVLAALVAVLAACGGDDGGSVDLTIDPVLEERREGLNEEETLELFQAIMERRAEYIEGSADVIIESDGTVSVDYSGIDDDIARDLYSSPANLSLRRPREEGEGMIACRSDDGATQIVPESLIMYVENEGTGLYPACTLASGLTGDIDWVEADAGNGPIVNLDIASVALNTQIGPTLIIRFDTEGGQNLGLITADMIGLPLGIFIDDDLVAGPQIADVIQNGQIAIAGISLRDARILRAQLRAGAVPAPYTVTFHDE